MYTCTTDKNVKVSSAYAINKGINDNGGLFVLESIPKVDLKSLLDLSYIDLASYILKLYLDDITELEIKEIVQKAYQNKFDTENIVQVKKTNNCYFLELFHGPTLAFKDIALSVLPLLLNKSKEKLGINKKTTILTATSGDTGSAALCGFHNSPNTDIIVFYPNNGVSPIQEAQMLKYNNDNSLVVALDGNFDDAQNFVKKIFTDDYFQTLQNTSLSSANSINIGRLIPQIVYYFYAYFELVKNKEINLNEKVNFVVPTGNFGNILAGYYALKMGLPIQKLICASNQNNVLTDFFENGVYNRERPLYKTISPSMDILISSNLERLLYYSTNNDCELVKELMDSLKNNKRYMINDEIKRNLHDFVSYTVTEKETKDAIFNLFQKENYLIDTHTSVAYNAYLKYLQNNFDNTKTIIVSTAHPFKFSGSILEAFNCKTYDDEFLNIKKLSEITNVKIPNQIKDLKVSNQKTIWKKEEAYALLKEKVK